VKTILIAHRGAQEIAPENTLSAFSLALHRGFPAVECDVQLSRDGKLVIIHDETLHRTTGKPGWVSRHTFAELRKLPLQGQERIPTLSEVIELVIRSARRRLVIEIKADSEAHAEKVALVLAKALAKLSATESRRVEVHSFWYKALRLFKRKCPLVTTAAIVGGGFDAPEIIAIAQKYQANGVSLNYEFVSKSIVRDCHAAGLFVDTWAVPDGTVMKRLRRFGLEAIVENYTGKKIPIASS